MTALSTEFDQEYEDADTPTQQQTTPLLTTTLLVAFLGLSIGVTGLTLGEHYSNDTALKNSSCSAETHQ